jgi:hydrogenase maturation protein HypF
VDRIPEGTRKGEKGSGTLGPEENGFASSIVRYEVKVLGLVQGVGFRPFVAKLARKLRLTGYVLNDGTGVLIDIEGPADRLDEFLERLKSEAPPLSRISSIQKSRAAPKGYESFSVRESSHPSERFALVSPDIATCDECLHELRDPQDRRHRYPFTNCTNCGPRFTIVKDVPYDRIRTTMHEFQMCEDCSREYSDDSDRRFHAEPIACAVCGPSVRLVNKSATRVPGEPTEKTATVIEDGAIVAVKGLGGYHLACDATNSLAVSALRSRKCREEKPLAVMVRDLKAAKSLCFMSETEENLLTSRQRPIVLLAKRENIPIVEEVAPGNKNLGVMLPYTPLHHLLLEKTPPLVMTSGNLTEEPLAYKDDEALMRLGTIADYFLIHDRDIFTRCDDSVARIIAGNTQMIRRSRGYVPDPVRLPFRSSPLLAVGAELKNTFCLIKDDLAFPGHHIGDLENLEAYEALKGGIEHLKKLLFIEPELIAHDMHPDYLSTVYAHECDLPLKAVQHHHAHTASCMAENGLTGRVIGLSFDGTGYGGDGSVWGGEFLVADYERFERVAHFARVGLPGGEAAINEPWRMGVSYLYAAFGRELLDMKLPVFDRVGFDKIEAVVRMIERRVNTLPTSSCGRLFDAVSSLVGIRDAVAFEGQAAMELEWAASQDSVGEPYPYRVRVQDGGHVLDFSETIKEILGDVGRGETVANISRRFHETLCVAAKDVCELVRQNTGLERVCMSGGVFQNALLSTILLETLEKAGFDVYVHSVVPPNDGGISLGQAAIAAYDSGGTGR